MLVLWEMLFITQPTKTYFTDDRFSSYDIVYNKGKFNTLGHKNPLTS